MAEGSNQNSRLKKFAVIGLIASAVFISFANTILTENSKRHSKPIHRAPIFKLPHIVMRKKETWVFIDKSGKTVLGPYSEQPEDFSDGIAQVWQGTDYAYINKKGAFICRCPAGSQSFQEGLAAVRGEKGWSYIDKSGLIVIPGPFAHADFFCEGLAAVELFDAPGKLNFINKTGKLAMKSNFQADGSTFGRLSSSDFHDGLSRVSIDHLYGFIDKAGKMVIPAKYGYAAPFKDGVATVGSDGAHVCCINRLGEKLFGENFWAIHSFSDHRAAAYSDDNSGFIDETGCWIISGKSPIGFHDERGFVQLGQTKYSCIDTRGVRCGPLLFSEVKRFSEGLAPVQQVDSWGFIDVKGEYVIPPKFAEAHSFHDGLAAVKLITPFNFSDYSFHIVRLDNITVEKK